jgi:hypothetical protein
MTTFMLALRIGLSILALPLLPLVEWNERRLRRKNERARHASQIR